MRTLAEIEAVVNRLPTAQKLELMLFLAQTLRKNQAPLPKPREFSKEQLDRWMDDDEMTMCKFRSGT